MVFKTLVASIGASGDDAFDHFRRLFLSFWIPGTLLLISTSASSRTFSAGDEFVASFFATHIPDRVAVLEAVASK